MSCASCVAKIEGALTRLPGVVSASVNLGTEKAVVRYIGRLVSAADMKRVIEGAYKVLDVAEEDLLEKEARLRRDEVNRVRRRLVAGTVLVVPLFVLSSWEMLGLAALLFQIPRGLSVALQWVLATPIQFWVARPFYAGAWSAARHGTTNMNTLIAVGTSAAYGYSGGGALSAVLRDSGDTRPMSTSTRPGRSSSLFSWGGCWRRGRKDGPRRRSSA